MEEMEIQHCISASAAKSVEMVHIFEAEKLTKFYKQDRILRIPIWEKSNVILVTYGM